MKYSPEYFAKKEYLDLCVYTALARREHNPTFKKLLGELVDHEQGDYDFWCSLSQQKTFRTPWFKIRFFILLRWMLGLMFTAKLLEGRERKAVKEYESYIATLNDQDLKEKIRSIVEHEQYHERCMIDQVKEDRVKFISNIVLGLNDGLIELTGALAGFTIALREPSLVALTGFITGISASLSMAASAYMQARHEPNREPYKAAFYTGTSYFIVVVLLIAPYLLLEPISLALGGMLISATIIIAAVSFYSSVILARVFARQFIEMLVLSLGVASIAFLIGLAFREFTGIAL